MFSENQIEYRWHPYFLRRGEEYSKFWQEYLQSSNRDLLFVLAVGLDPRTCHGLTSILNSQGNGTRDVMLIEFDEGPNSPSSRFEDKVRANMSKILELVPSTGNRKEKKIDMWSSDRRRTGSRNALSIFSDLSDLNDYTDLIVDVSAMPRGIYFPLIGKMLHLIDSSQNMDSHAKKANLHVVVSENPELDQRITEEGIDDEASYMAGFTSGLTNQATEALPKVWIPTLGRGKLQQVQRINNLVSPTEICPMMPMPSLDPYLSEQLLVEYRQFLFESLHIESRNIMNVAENNPFEVYRQIKKTVYDYNQALRSLGGCQVVLSALSSKLLSIGSLLAAYDLKERSGGGVGVAHVEAQGYSLNGEFDIGREWTRSQLSTMWLAGECYDY